MAGSIATGRSINGKGKMRSWTGIEIAAERERLEREAALILGHMLFEHSRLDMDLGLMLVWADDGKRLEKLTIEHNESNFYCKLRFLEKEASFKYEHSPDALTAHAGWLVDAHRVRGCRNKLVHGRWGIEPTRQQVVNVVGMPTSADQKSFPYSIPELQAELDAVKSLRARLQELRQAWPL